MKGRQSKRDKVRVNLNETQHSSSEMELEVMECIAETKRWKKDGMEKTQLHW